MADIELVIKIQEEEYERFKKNQKKEYTASMLDVNIIANGTPLPKGHGRLIDANRLRSMYSINRANFNTVVGIQKWIDEAPTIIEADDSESEEP